MMIFDKIKQLESELKQNLNCIPEFEFSDPIHKGAYRSTIDAIGWDLTRIFDKILSVHDGFQMIWKVDELIKGEVFINGLIFNFNDFAQEHYIHAFDEFGEEFKTFARQFYPLDIYKESLDEVTLTVVKIIDEEHLELWIWNNAGQKYKLKFQSIEEYLEAGVQCKFIICWQYFYIDTEALDFNDPFTKEWIASDFFGAISRMNDAFATMKEHFPQEDWSYQEKELERVVKLN